MKSFSPAGAATKAYYGLGARTFGNPDGAHSGGGAYAAGGDNPDGPNQGGGGGGSGGLTFTFRNAPANASGRSLNVTYGNGAMCMTDSGGLLFRSANDGVSWTNTLDISATLQSLTGVGTDGAGVWLTADDTSPTPNFYRSIDNGLTWSAGSGFPVGFIATNVHFATDGLGHWVAVGNTGTGSTDALTFYATSSDNGATWTAPGLFNSGGFGYALWNGVQFVATAYHDTPMLTVATSVDLGQHWTETDIPGFTFQDNPTIAHDSVTGLYIIGDVGTTNIRVSNTPAGLGAATNHPTPGDQIQSVFAANGVLLAFGQAGSLSSSGNGVTWTLGALNFPFPDAAYNCAFDSITHAYVAVGDNSDVSTLGVTTPVTWVRRVSGTPNTLLAVGFGNAIFLATSTTGQILRSTDSGASWAVAATIAGPPTLNAIAYGNGRWLAVGHSGAASRVYRSTDNGSTWGQLVDLQLPTGPLNAVAYDPVGDIWLVLGTGSTANNYSVSADGGNTWTLPGAFTNSGWLGVIWDGAQFVATGLATVTADGQVCTSAAGHFWAANLINTADAFRPLALGLAIIIGAQFLPNTRHAASAAALATAADIVPGLQGAITALAFGRSTYIATDSQGGTASSADASTWQNDTLGFGGSSAAGALAFGNNVFVAVGDGGQIATG